MALKPSLRDVLPSELHAQALAALASHQEATRSMPWFVKILIGFGAWVASWFLLAFLSLGVVVGKEVGALVLGLVLSGATASARRMGNNVFLTQLTLSTGLAGQALCIGAVASLSDSAEAAALATVVLEGVLLFVYPDAIQRFLSALAASLALLLLLHLTAPSVLVDVALVGLTALAHQLFLRQGPLQGRRWGALVTPAAFGLVTTLLFVLLMRSWFPEVYWEFSHHSTVSRPPPGVLTFGLAAVTLYSVGRALEETGSDVGGAPGVTAFAVLAVLSLLTWHTPGVIAAAGVLLLGFHRRSVVLLGMAVVFFLVFGVSYYYDLELTLLAKSLALLGSGLVLLGLRLFVLRRFPAPAEVR